MKPTIYDYSNDFEKPKDFKKYISIEDQKNRFRGFFSVYIFLEIVF